MMTTIGTPSSQATMPFMGSPFPDPCVVGQTPGSRAKFLTGGAH
jgi:hypothetical protein